MDFLVNFNDLLHKMELNELVNKYQQKDITAFNKLYEIYAEQLRVIINRIVLNKEDTEEILQDVFIKVWNDSEKYCREKGKFRTWLVCISRNAAIDKIRSKKFKIQKQNCNLSFYVDSFKSNDDLDKSVNAIGVRSYVNKMTEKDKNLIELIYFEGYTQKEVSEKINIPLGTVKTNLRKCLKNLRIMMVINME